MGWTDRPDVPKAPVGLHQRLVQTLEGLPERKEGLSLKRKHLTKVLVAAAVIVVLATAAIAGGRLLSVTSHSYHDDDFYELPSAAQAARTIGSTGEPKMLDAFSNGYVFDHGGVSENELETESGQTVGGYRAMDLRYTKGSDEVWLDLCCGEVFKDPDAEELERGGLTLYYTRQAYKFVPPDYELTEQDEKDQADGTYVFSWGTDAVEVKDFQHLSWARDGVRYELFTYDSAMERDELTDMACELMAG